MPANTADVEVYVPEHLKLWEYPSNYIGAYWDGWYVFYGTNRDADLLRESNWECIKRDLVENPSAAEEERGLLIVEESHWAVGWVQWMGIHQSDYELLKRADEIAGKLEDYPVYDDEDYSSRQCDAQYESIKQLFHDFCNDNWEEVEPADGEEEIIVDMLCQAQPDFNSTPDEDDMWAAYEKVHGHVLHCAEHGTFLESDPCPCQMRMF